MYGRFHYYEGHHINEVTFPVRVMKLYGVETLIVTNAAGGVNTMLYPGDLMIIKDHINLMGTNPLIGKNEDKFGPRFPDMSDIYCKEIRDLIKTSMKNLNISIKEGVYTAFTGPSYETPAEIRMVSITGGDTVGMSTAPKAIVATHMGMKVGGISCITNMASGISKEKLSHKEVIDTSNAVKSNFISLLSDLITRL